MDISSDQLWIIAGIAVGLALSGAGLLFGSRVGSGVRLGSASLSVTLEELEDWEKEILEVVSSSSGSWSTSVDRQTTRPLGEALERARLQREPETPGIKPSERTKAIKALEKRLDDFERRFPEASEIDKYASVNEALMQQKIEFIGQQLEELKQTVIEHQKNSLTTGKVFGIVFTVVAGLFAVVAAIPIVIDLFKK